MPSPTWADNRRQAPIPCGRADLFDLHHPISERWHCTGQRSAHYQHFSKSSDVSFGTSVATITGTNYAVWVTNTLNGGDVRPIAVTVRVNSPIADGTVMTNHGCDRFQ